MKNFQEIKSKDSFRVKYIHASFLYIFILWIESKYDRSKISIFHSQRAHFLSCLLRKKKSSKIGTSLSNVENFIRATSFPSIFIFIYTLYFRKGQNRNINRNFFTHHTTIHLEFYFPYFSSNFFFLSFFIPSSRSCATLKYDRLRFIKRYALPPPEKNPSRRGCSLINNPLSVFFSFSFFFFLVLFIVLEPSSLHLVYLFILLFSLSPHRDNTGKRHTRPRGVLTRNTGPINTEIPSRNGFHARSRLFRIRLANDNALIPS